MERKEQIKRVVVAFFGGGLFAVGFLMIIGETGGGMLRENIREEREAYEEYRTTCEATLNRAFGAMTMAEGMHADLARQRDDALAQKH